MPCQPYDWKEDLILDDPIPEPDEELEKDLDPLDVALAFA